MLRVSVTELKNQLSKYLRLVKQGETVEVLERSIPIARLEAIAASPRGEVTRRRRLIQDGVLAAARRKPTSKLLDDPPIPCAVDPTRVLIEERGER